MIQSLSLTGSSFLILFIATNLAFRCYLSTANLNCKHKLLELKLFARVRMLKKNIRWPFYRVKTPPRIHYSLKKNPSQEGNVHAIHPCSGALGDHEHHTPRDPLAGAHRRQPAGSYQPLPRSAHTWRPQPKVRRPRDGTAAPPKSNNRPQDPMASSSSPGQGGSTSRLARGDDVTWQLAASTAWKQAWLVLLQLRDPVCFHSDCHQLQTRMPLWPIIPEAFSHVTFHFILPE